ncbi:MAG: DNA gyrase inhibitor YacG [Terriglobales bacterium]
MTSSDASSPTRSLRCPICRKPVPPDAPDFPFCSSRCRTIDLGNWASGLYRVPVKPEDEDGGSSN